MPFINAHLNEAQEAEVVPEGVYEVRNHDAEVKASKKGADMIVVTSIIESAEYPNAAPIMTYLSLPNDNDEERARSFKLLQLRRFCEAFGIPFEDNGFDTDDIAGTTGELQVKQDIFQPVLPDGSPDPSKEPMQSNKLVLPRLARGDEGPEPVEAAPPARGRATAPAAPQRGARNAGRR